MVLDYLWHVAFSGELHSFPGVIVLLALATVAVSAFSFIVFGIINRLEHRVVEQNRQLSAMNSIAATSAENLELQEVLNVALDKVLEVMQADAGII